LQIKNTNNAKSEFRFKQLIKVNPAVHLQSTRQRQFRFTGDFDQRQLRIDIGSRNLVFRLDFFFNKDGQQINYCLSLLLSHFRRMLQLDWKKAPHFGASFSESEKMR
jgi:hypothetical protein